MRDPHRPYFDSAYHGAKPGLFANRWWFWIVVALAIAPWIVLYEIAKAFI